MSTPPEHDFDTEKGEMRPHMIRVGSMCTGYGGLDLGVEAALGPTSVEWVADPDPGASRILTHRFPDVPNLGDIRAFPWETAAPVDVLTAGFPCQPVSMAGRRAGTSDERWLFDDICTAIGRMGARPRLLVFENVPGLLTANRGHAMARVVHGLARLGYMGSWRTLAAADVGAPHRRKRVFIVAHLADPDSVHAPDLYRIPDPGQGPIPGASPTADPAHLRHHRARTPRVRRSGSAHSGHPATDPAGLNGQGRSGRHRRSDADPSGRTAWGRYADAITRWERVTGHVAPAPTEPTGREGAHRLSPRFVEWMMGLTPGWVTDVPGLSRTAQLRALGNGVVWPQAAAGISDQLPTAPR